MKKTYWIVAACVIASLALMLWGFYADHTPQIGPPPTYALLLTEDRGTAVMQLKQGAQNAADTLGAELAIHIAEQDQPADVQLLSMLDALVGSAADGIILPPCGEETLRHAKEIAARENIPLVWLSAEATDGVIGVSTDYAAEGKLLAEAYMNLPDAEKGAVAVFTGTDDHSEQRLEGVRALLHGATVCRTDASTLVDTIAALPDNTCLLVLDAALTQALSDANAGRLPLFGIDPGDARVRLLADGLARGLVMEMPYTQGYLAVEALWQGKKTTQPVYAPSRLVTKETMYLSENVKLVFPLLQ